MKILENYNVPTGNILIVEGEKGKLECLSIGDYGKDVNLKADFMGLNRSIDHVEHQEMMPLTKKWVVTISTQYGCSMDCKFCDVPKVGRGVNATYNDLLEQVETALSLHPEVHRTDRLNIHFARMGEPTWNSDVIEFAGNLHNHIDPLLNGSLIHPVISTMMPKHNKKLQWFIETWVDDIKNFEFSGDAGLQISVNSTSEKERENMFSGNALSLEDISDLMHYMPRPQGRKYTLNFAVADYEINAWKLARLFDPKKFLVKLTPMHKTLTALDNGIKTIGDYATHYPYDEAEQNLKDAGFDVIIFIASDYEDLSRITCGNAILSGSNPEITQ